MANKQARYSIGVTTAEYDDANCIRDDSELKDYKGEKMCRKVARDRYIIPALF